MIIKKIT